MVDDDITFNIKATMNKRWVDHFCSMLKRMEYDGSLGHSEAIGFYSDGDGDYRPKFEIYTDYEEIKGRNPDYTTVKTIFDAG